MLSVLNLLGELWGFLKQRKKFWLMPMVFVLLIVGGMLIAVQGSVVAPFIYALF